MNELMRPGLDLVSGRNKALSALIPSPCHLS